MSHIVSQGMRSPFAMLEKMDSYNFYCATFLVAGKRPRSHREFKDDNFKIFEHAQERMPKIIKKAKKYKCYAL